MMKRVVLFLTCLLLSGSTGAQTLTKHQESEMLDCIFLRKEGPWIDPNLYHNGKARFAYLYESSKLSKQGTLYVAIWNSKKTEGKLVVLVMVRSGDQRDTFNVVNDGRIYSKEGQLDIEDLLWGVYTHQEVKSRLPKLKERPVSVVALAQLRRTSAVCHPLGGE